MEEAEKTVCLSSSVFELASKQKMFKEIFAKLKKRNVDVKIMVPDNEEEAKKISKKLGITIKSRPINARFVIVDKEELIFTIRPTNVHEDFDYGVWINSPFFTSSLTYMFELAYKD
jgi:hypothetical protein